MIETYHTEVTKKRRNARWFWVIVFLFAIFLYFFFQGYYPDVRLGIKRMFLEDTTNTASGNFDDLIRSFGIINVKTIPTTAVITIGSGAYGNNEKRMTNYGAYTMNIESPWYRENSLNFSIDKEKPYFIEEISLLPIPKYSKTIGIATVYQVDNDTYLIQTASWLTASGIVSNTGIITKNPNLKHIGGLYFQSGTTLYGWWGDRLSRSNDERENFVNTCQSTQWISNNSLYCPGVGSMYTENNIYMTGITDIYRGLMRTQSGNIIDMYRGYTRIPSSYSGNVTDIHRLDDIYYVSSGGLLSPISSWWEPIITPLETITLAQVVSTEMIIVWQRGWKNELLIRHKKDPIDRSRTIELPSHLNYRDAEFVDREGNIFIKTPEALLFIYRGGNEAIWIIDGTILALYPGWALYMTENEVWHANWDSEE